MVEAWWQFKRFIPTPQEKNSSALFLRPDPFLRPFLRPDGSKPIEQLKPGDMVLSAPDDAPDAPVVAKRVEEVFQRGVGRILELRVGGQLIRTTHEHPFYVEGEGWKQACALSSGDLLRSHEGRTLPVELISDTNDDVTVYNMRIEEYHTYFVGCPEWGFSVWSHNANCAEAASALGFDKRVKDPPFNSHGQPVFQKGSRYLTPDVDSHNGGVWKLFRKDGTRLATLDANGNPIGG